MDIIFKKEKKLVALTGNQIEFIKKISVDRQISFTESLRRILDEYIRSSEEK